MLLVPGRRSAEIFLDDFLDLCCCFCYTASALQVQESKLITQEFFEIQQLFRLSTCLGVSGLGSTAVFWPHPPSLST